MRFGGVNNNYRCGSHYREAAPIEINVDPELAMAIYDLAIEKAKAAMAQDDFKTCVNMLEGASEITEAIEEYRNELEENEDPDEAEDDQAD